MPLAQSKAGPQSSPDEYSLGAGRGGREQFNCIRQDNTLYYTNSNVWFSQRQESLDGSTLRGVCSLFLTRLARGSWSRVPMQRWGQSHLGATCGESGPSISSYQSHCDYPMTRHFDGGRDSGLFIDVTFGHGMALPTMRCAGQHRSDPFLYMSL